MKSIRIGTWTWWWAAWSVIAAVGLGEPLSDDLGDRVSRRGEQGLAFCDGPVAGAASAAAGGAVTGGAVTGGAGALAGAGEQGVEDVLAGARRWWDVSDADQLGGAFLGLT